MGNNPKPLPKKIEYYKRPKFDQKELLKRKSTTRPVDVYAIDRISIPYNEMELYLHAKACYNVKEYERYSMLFKDLENLQLSYSRRV